MYLTLNQRNLGYFHQFYSHIFFSPLYLHIFLFKHIQNLLVHKYQEQEQPHVDTNQKVYYNLDHVKQTSLMYLTLNQRNLGYFHQYFFHNIFSYLILFIFLFKLVQNLLVQKFKEEEQPHVRTNQKVYYNLDHVKQTIYIIMNLSQVVLILNFKDEEQPKMCSDQ